MRVGVTAFVLAATLAACGGENEVSDTEYRLAIAAQAISQYCVESLDGEPSAEDTRAKDDAVRDLEELLAEDPDEARSEAASSASDLEECGDGASARRLDRALP